MQVAALVEQTLTTSKQEPPVLCVTSKNFVKYIVSDNGFKFCSTVFAFDLFLLNYATATTTVKYPVHRNSNHLRVLFNNTVQLLREKISGY